MLSMRAIQKIYRTDLVETHALHDFSLDVEGRRVRGASWGARARARRRS